MRVAEDGRSIDLTIGEAFKLQAIGFRLVCNDGRVDAIVENGKIGGQELDDSED